MKGRKSILTLVIAAVIALSALFMLTPVSATSTSTGSDVSPDYIKANSEYVAMVKLVTGPSSSLELRIVNLSFSGTGFDTSDLYTLSATGTSGVSIWKDTGNGQFDGQPTDSKITLSTDPTWDGTNLTLSLTSGHTIGNTFFVVIKTSSTISNGDVINVTVTRLQEYNTSSSTYSDLQLNGVNTAQTVADTVAPTVPNGAIIHPNGGEVWSGTQTITWSGITDAHFGANPITIYYSDDGGSTWNTLVAATGNDGSYTWDTTSFTDGSSYKINITATDEAGNYNYDISNATFTIDNTAPTVSITLPVDGSYYKSGDAIDSNITGTASDVTSGVDHVNITIYNQTGGKYWTGSAWQTGIAWLNTNGTTNWYNDSGLPTWGDGNTYVVTAVAVDAAGNSATDTSTFTYDTTPPTSSVNTISPYWKNSSPLTITATANDATSGVANVTLYYRYSSDNSSWGAWTSFGVDTSSPWSWSFNFPNGTGYYEFYSIAVDNAGNTESAPANNDTICGYDYTAPTSSVDTITPYWRTTSSISITSSIFSDDLSGIAYVDLYYRWSPDNSTTWSNWIFSSRETIPDGGHYTWSFSFPNGTAHYQFYTIATDNAGNIESAPGSADAVCGYDYTGPDTTIATPTNNGYYNSLANITGTATDDLSGVDYVNITIYNQTGDRYWNGTGWQTSVAWLTTNIIGSGISVTWYRNSLPTWTDGSTYIINSTAVDVAGNVETSPDSNTFTYDTTPPTSAVNTISPYWKNSSPLTLTATASDSTSGVANVTLYYRYSNNNGTWDAWTNFGVDTSSPWSWSFNFPNGTGYYQFYTIAVDNASNSESAPGAADASCGYDTTAPTSTVSAISGYWKNLGDNPLMITGTASDSLSGLHNVSLYYYYSNNNSTWSGPALFGVDSDPWASISWSFTFPSGEGYYRFYSIAIDNASNSESAPTSNDTMCGYDTTAPTCTIEYSSSATYFKAGDTLRIYANFTETGSGIDPSSVIINISTVGDGDLDNASMSQTDNTHWYYDWTIPSGSDDDGTFTVKIFAQDNASNHLSPYPTTDSSKSIDNTNPTSVILIPVNGSYYNSLNNVTGYATDTGSGIHYVWVGIKNVTDNKWWQGGSWDTSAVYHAATLNTSIGAHNVTWWRTFLLPTWVNGKTYAIVVYAEDVAGNSESSHNNTFFFEDVAPSVSNVLITDTTISSTLYVRNGDSVSVTATITDSNLNAGDTSYLKADLSGFGLGSAVAATAYNGTVAWWNFTVVSCSPSDGTITVTINATDPAGNYNNTEYDTITADNTAPTFDYAVFSPDYNGNEYSYIDVYFSESIDNSTTSTTDFSISVSGVTVTAVYNDANTNKITLKLNHKITGGGPTISISGNGVDDLVGNTMSSGTVTINTYRISLSEGWNLISIPADVSSISIRTLLNSIWSNINMSTTILWYNASSQTWLTYIPSQQTGTLTCLEPGKAYWIKMNASDTLIGNYSVFPHGTSPTPIVELTGHRWNMIGHWTVYNQTADTSGGLSSLSDVLASSGEILYKYDTTTGAFVNIYGSSSTNMEPGVGYWLWLKTSQNGYYTIGEQSS